MDSIDKASWPDERRQLYHDALNGIQSGNLKPLAEFIKGGFAVEGDLAFALASAIDSAGEGDFIIKILGRRKNIRTISRELSDHERKITIGAYAHVWIKGHTRGLGKKVRKELSDHFEIGETYLRQCLSYFRRHMAIINGDDGADYNIPGAPREWIDLISPPIILRNAEADFAAARDLSDNMN